MARVSKSPEERRAEIIDAGEKLFLEKGIENCSVSDIVKYIGVAQGTFYYHFKSKEELLEAIISKYADFMFDNIGEILKDESIDIFERLKKVIMLRTQILTSEGHEVGALIYGDKSDMVNKKHLAIIQNRLKPIIIDVMKKAAEEGKISVKYVEETVELLLMMGEQILFTVNSEKDMEKIKRKMEVMDEAARRILGISGDKELNFFGGLEKIKRGENSEV